MSIAIGGLWTHTDINYFHFSYKLYNNRVTVGDDGIQHLIIFVFHQKLASSMIETKIAASYFSYS